MRSFLLLTALVVSFAEAQNRPQTVTAPSDSTEADTLVARIIEGIGDAVPGRAQDRLADSTWQWTEVRTLPQVFGTIPGVYLFNAGEEGSTMGAWYLGNDIVAEGITADGLPIGSDLYAENAFTFYPLEFVEGVEELSGPDALLLGARWNLRSYQYASPKPRTAVRFAQLPNETIFTDAFFSQNVARSTNLHFGIQRRVSGGRFDNSGFDSWALRGRVRYNVTPRLNIMGSWRYDKTSHGLNGGVDRLRSQTIFDEVTAVVVEPDAYGLRTSTFLSLHALADVFNDSLSLTRVMVSTFDEEREFNRTIPTPYRPATREFAISSTSRYTVEQSLRISILQLHGMASIQKESSADSTILRGLDRSTTSFGGSAEIKRIPLFVPSVGVRVDRSPEGSATSVAAAARLSLLPGLSVSAAFERRTSMPGLRETAWRDSLVMFPSQIVPGHEDRATAGARWEYYDDSYVELGVFHRTQTDRLIYRRDTTASGTAAIRGSYVSGDLSGVQASARFTLRPFSLSGWVSTLTAGTASGLADVAPKVSAGWEAVWKDRLFNDELGLNVTVRGIFFDRSFGLSPDPRTGLRVIQTAVPVGRVTRLDGCIVLDIGDAFITLAWENILSSDYFLLSTYPMPQRQFSLGVRWNFFD